MNNNKQGGFSLIELLLVVVIIGVIATIGIPNFIRGIAAAENGSANSTMKVILSSQTSFYSQNGRYARLDELNRLHQDTLGIVASNQLTRGKFTFEMIPANPTDAQLKDGYMIKASRPGGGGNLPYVVEITEGGFNTPIFP
jgi:prepilin-type N-terminal cleavage/methylation domain-containing protein